MLSGDGDGLQEVVQSALLESGGSSRENRIMYLKLSSLMQPKVS